MSELKIILPIKAFSINSMYYATKKIKTPEALEWTAQICYMLKNPEIHEQFKKLKSEFDVTKHGFAVELLYLYPFDRFYKDTSISGRTMDQTNVEKPLVDILFLPQFYNAAGIHGAKNLNTNDVYILDVISRKRASTNGRYEIHINISIIPNEYESSRIAQNSLEHIEQP